MIGETVLDDVIEVPFERFALKAFSKFLPLTGVAVVAQTILQALVVMAQTEIHNHINYSTGRESRKSKRMGQETSFLLSYIS